GAVFVVNGHWFSFRVGVADWRRVGNAVPCGQASHSEGVGGFLRAYSRLSSSPPLFVIPAQAGI
ncbi:TPA: hypothetical protein ACFNM3_002269, partial [Neisseria lactamica]